jgi:hypothetical protein
MKSGGHNFHPSRISNRAKAEMKRTHDALAKKKVAPPLKPIDLKKNDWSKKP